jgi:hypothetical protein
MRGGNAKGLWNSRRVRNVRWVAFISLAPAVHHGYKMTTAAANVKETDNRVVGSFALP